MKQARAASIALDRRYRARFRASPGTKVGVPLADGVACGAGQPPESLLGRS
jgi:hypothetical protein